MYPVPPLDPPLQLESDKDEEEEQEDMELEEEEVETEVEVRVEVGSQQGGPAWKTTAAPVSVGTFIQPVGPKVALPVKILEVFQHFLTASFIQSIVDRINLYANQVMTPKAFDRWTPITLPELQAYNGFIILMGVNHLPALADYWKLDTVLCTQLMLTKSPGTDSSKYPSIFIL